MAKCKYWRGPYKECKLINTHKPCPSNVDLTSCDIIPKKPKTKSVRAKLQGTWRIEGGNDHGVIINGLNVSLLHADIPVLINEKYLKAYRVKEAK